MSLGQPTCNPALNFCTELLRWQVCGELLGILEAVDDFCKFLGAELKAVTGDASVVDGVARMVQVGLGSPCPSACQPFRCLAAGCWAGTLRKAMCSSMLCSAASAPQAASRRSPPVL